MQANPGIFLKRVSNYSFLEEEQREKLLLYFKDRFFTEVIFHETVEDFDILEKILKELNYECDKIRSFFSAANTIRRVKNPNIRPSCQYVEVLLRILKEFNLDCEKYNINNMPACNVLDYVVKRILDGKEKLNGEISIFELTHQIYNKYYFGKDKNEAVVKILKILDSVEKGIVNRKDSVFLNKKIMDLFECSQDISDLSLRKVVETYYPYFKNELFSIIKKATELEEMRPLDSYKLARYLDDLKEIWDKADSRIRTVVNDIWKVDLSSNENVNKVFRELMDSVRGNKIIDETMKESILIQIKEIYERYQNSELVDVENELKNFFKNYSYFVFDLIIPTWSKQDDFRELISSCLHNCKDFFVKCDGEKFKEIVEYLINFTNLEAADLVETSKKCVDIFKDSCKEKMRIINDALNDFSKSLDVDNASVFEDVFIKNPQLLLNDEKNLISIVEFLKGNISLKDYGCSWDFKLPLRFLSKNFYRKLENNDFKELFDVTLNVKCSPCQGHFKLLRVN